MSGLFLIICLLFTCHYPLILTGFATGATFFFPVNASVDSVNKEGDFSLIGSRGDICNAPFPEPIPLLLSIISGGGI